MVGKRLGDSKMCSPCSQQYEIMWLEIFLYGMNDRKIELRRLKIGRPRRKPIRIVGSKDFLPSGIRETGQQHRALHCWTFGRVKKHIMMVAHHLAEL
jgi:hypothetical protein